ncbi:ribose-phosphate pyrophosphokinase [Acanthopleuribacter pedis]|uniref:Ribose-phosphate pyrophosphokinase n=1 Tax=Acanthopleuribacter pedis TaxID=442870 RepID=A0A8J7QL26_9BACT|nr:ribose-phosphate pyrophosphokinase [Acanthopleuribacter pedis]MBO1319945.1 ribose-phosphate pyrophosphokinase [Acanthopleuribacter pedis]
MTHQAGEVLLFSGSSNRVLAEKISESMGVELGNIELGRFKDGEVSCQILENVRGADAFIVQSTCYPVNDHLMELLIILDAFKRASASRVTAVIPYFGYARQDRKDKPRVPISAKLVADLLLSAGASRVLTMDLHANQIQGFFDIPVDHLYGSQVLLEHIQRLDRNFVVVSPDAGGVERARAVAKRLDASLAIVDKRREKANVSKVMHIIGEVKGRDCIIIDDIIDTAGTLTLTAQALRDAGANSVFAACSHPVLSDPAAERIEKSVLEKVFLTDSIPLREDLPYRSKLEVVSIAGLLGEAIKRIHEESSISTLFD